MNSQQLQSTTTIKHKQLSKMILSLAKLSQDHRGEPAFNSLTSYQGYLYALCGHYAWTIPSYGLREGQYSPSRQGGVVRLHRISELAEHSADLLKIFATEQVNGRARAAADEGNAIGRPFVQGTTSSSLGRIENWSTFVANVLQKQQAKINLNYLKAIKTLNPDKVVCLDPHEEDRAKMHPVFFVYAAPNAALSEDHSVLEEVRGARDLYGWGLIMPLRT